MNRFKADFFGLIRNKAVCVSVNGVLFHYKPLGTSLKGVNMRKSLILILILLAGPALAPAVRAAGTESPPSPPRPSNPDYDAGKKALQSNDYAAAIASFTRAAASEPDNANVQNELGFSYRKSGDLDNAFKHYNEALRLDPKHKGAHEYIGEAYLMVNNLPKAEEHLAQLDKVCFFSCGEYKELKAAIESYKQQHAQR
jgi:tetratricopeptide (TPR) repeat protein